MKALDLAKYIVQLTDLSGCKSSNLQLQKIIYFVNLKHIKDKGSFLIDEPFEAWQFGPVVEEVYREYYLWSGLAIYTEQTQIDNKTLSSDMNS
ncbi:type II toxin-antitoxin system antitoxin SocA domain-containing protein, partial [Helicobacter sp. 13S00401-1]|uniref:Panacea domain-containing protein n=1 Tax=Helicobacter sp. 13S00401-1 TaxID=1905758 RepID=UPI00117B5716